MKANPKIVDEAQCGLCSGTFSIAEEIIKCEKCSSFYHMNCWSKSGGCSQEPCKEGMKQCPQCTLDVKEYALKCWHCGYYFDQSLSQAQIPPDPRQQDLNVGLKILSFCVPFAGIIVYLVYLGRSEPVKSKSACTYTIWGFIFGALLRIIILASQR
jgi:hypothetical protein